MTLAFVCVGLVLFVGLGFFAFFSGAHDDDDEMDRAELPDVEPMTPEEAAILLEGFTPVQHGRALRLVPLAPRSRDAAGVEVRQ